MSLSLWVAIALFHRFFATSLPLSNSGPPGHFTRSTLRGGGHEFWPNAQGLPGGMVTIGIDWYINARGRGLNDRSLSEGNSIAYMLLTGSIRAAIKWTAVSSFGVCMYCWYKISVNLASNTSLYFVRLHFTSSDLFCCWPAECCVQENSSC